MGSILGLSTSMYLIRVIFVLGIGTGLYYFKYEMLEHLYSVVVNEEGYWSSSDTFLVSGVIFAGLFLLAPGVADTFLAMFLSSCLGILGAFQIKLELDTINYEREQEPQEYEQTH